MPFIRLFDHLLWMIKGVKVYALVGKSGTGKSFRAKLVAEKFGIELIIDDGLLISDNKILAGKSAKKDKAYLSAIKTALFDDPKHLKEVRTALDRQQFQKILILGTSEKMVKTIGERMGLPRIYRTVFIDEVATQEEIERAINSRSVEGKHVIPVPAVEVSRGYSHILADTVKIFFRKKFALRKSAKVFEKTVVRPEFGNRGKVSISEAALTQMVLHCISEYNPELKVIKVTVKDDLGGYKIGIFIDAPYGKPLAGNLIDFQNYVIDNLEKFTGILVDEVNVIIDKISR